MNHDENPLRSFRPDLATFDLEWLDRSEEQGFELRAFRITTTRLSDGPVRTYGLVGIPPGPGPFPAILHIHGGCQSVCRDSVVYNLRRGYAAMSFDWSGSAPFTQYPASVDMKSDPLLVCDRDGAERCFPFLAARAARCCLALLASLDNVDPGRIGVYGVSWGGFITWLVNGTDSLPKCAGAIYGTGGLHWPGHLWNAQWGGLAETTRREWMRCVEPVGYAFTQRSPLFHLNGANDFFGGFDTAAQSLPSLPVDWRCDYTPNVNHGFDAGGARALEAWMDHHLRGAPPVPAAPPLRVTPTGDASVRVETEGAADRLTLWASFGPAPHPNRCWHPHTGWTRGDGAALRMDLEATGDAWFYVRASDPETGISVSSTPVCLSMPAAEARRRAPLFDGAGARSGWGYQMSIMPQSPASLDNAVSVDADGLTTRPGFAGWPSLVFFGLSDPGRGAGPDTRALIVELEGVERLTIQCVKTILGGGHACTVEKPDDGPLRLAVDRFCDGAGKPLQSFERLGYLVVGLEPRAGGPARIRRMSWD